METKTKKQEKETIEKENVTDTEGSNVGGPYKNKIKRNASWNKLFINDSMEGETLESKIERKISNGEPMNEPGVGLLFTERSKGVLPETNIRTDRFEIAIEGTDRIQKSYQARREERQKGKAEKGKDGGPETIQGTNEAPKN